MVQDIYAHYLSGFSQSFGQLFVIFRGFGVTRGVDFVFYVSFAAFGFLWLHLAGRIRDLEGRLTDLTRRIALDRTREPDRGQPEGAKEATR